MKSEFLLFEANNQSMSFYFVDSEVIGNTFIWAHGWGLDHSSMLTVASPFLSSGVHYFIDFPGFGRSEFPKSDWDTINYSDFILRFLKTIPSKKIWVSHSFGCRIGIRLCSIYPDEFDTMVLISSPGIDMRSMLEKCYRYSKVFLLKFVKFIVRHQKLVEFGKSICGSSDYKNSGKLRGTFVNVIDEDLSENIIKITKPVLLLYGDQDTKTSPESGKKISLMIDSSEIIVLEGVDHNSIIFEGSHRVALYIKRFLDKYVDR